MFHVNWWYPEEKAKKNYKAKDCGGTVSFYPNRGQYLGNLFYDGKCVADYVCDDSTEMEKIWSNIWEED